MDGKVALITGGANGIGKACAVHFLECKAKKVYVADINVTNGQDTEQELNEKFGENKAKFIKCDVSNREEFEDAFRIVYDENNNLDLLLNNAGIGENSEVINVNFIGTLNGIELSLKYMCEKNQTKCGVIINTISILGFEGFDYIPKFVATKHAVVGLTKVYSRPCYFDKTNVRVMVICPGLTDTGIFQTNEAKEIMGLLDKLTAQSPKVVAECVMEMLKNGENGSFWGVENGEIFEIEIPSYISMRKNKKTL